MDDPVTVREAVERLGKSVASLGSLSDWMAFQVSRIANEVADDGLVPTARECSDLIEWARQVTGQGAVLMQQVAQLDIIAERESALAMLNGDRQMARRNLKHWEEVGDATA